MWPDVVDPGPRAALRSSASRVRPDARPSAPDLPPERRASRATGAVDRSVIVRPGPRSPIAASASAAPNIRIAPARVSAIAAAIRGANPAQCPGDHQHGRRHIGRGRPIGWARDRELTPSIIAKSAQRERGEEAGRGSARLRGARRSPAGRQNTGGPKHAELRDEKLENAIGLKQRASQLGIGRAHGDS